MSRLLRVSLMTLLLLPFAGCFEEEEQEEQGQSATATGGSDTGATEFLRLVDHGDGRADLETAIATYVHEDGRRVDLIGAIHVGEESYYDTLNRVFRIYDSLLYEMIKPRDASPVRSPGGEESAVSGLQRMITNVLDLEFQLDGIDYAAENFVHADLDPDTFFELQAERGESIFTLMMSAMLQAMKSGALGNSALSQEQMIATLRSGDTHNAMKRILAHQFADLERMAAGLETTLGGEESVIVVARNKAALEVMEAEFEAGKERLGLFYGAAHLPDMERRLIEEYGFELEEVQFLPAWQIVADEPASDGP